jgi:hypothetical protein
LLSLCVKSRTRFPEEKSPFAQRREGLLQRENSVRAGIKKQHLPMKNRFFRLDAPFFSFSIRSASECSFRWWFINF